MNRLISFGCAVVGSISAIAHAGGDSLIGVLEEPQCNDGAGTYVRALYVKSKGEWHSLNTAKAWAAGRIPKRTSWVVSLDGKQIGEVETEDRGSTTNNDLAHRRHRRLNVVPSKPSPSIPNRSESFEGWCGAPRNRPLIVTMSASVSEPDKWRPYTPSQKEVAQLFPKFRARVGDTFTCLHPDGQSDIKVKYSVDDVHALKSYASSKGARLITIALSLDPGKENCEGNEEAWNPLTFFVKGKTTYLGANIDLLDSGDYDADGASELLFWHSGYNEDGYILFSPAMNAPVEYFWSYH